MWECSSPSARMRMVFSLDWEREHLVANTDGYGRKRIASPGWTRLLSVDDSSVAETDEKDQKPRVDPAPFRVCSAAAEVAVDE